MTKERIEELRDCCGSFNNAPSWIVVECLDEIERLQKLVADCRPLDDAIKQQERRRAGEKARLLLHNHDWVKSGITDPEMRKLIAEIERGAE